MKKNMILIAALIFLMLLMTACTGNDPLTPSPTVPSATIPSDNNAGSPRQQARLKAALRLNKSDQLSGEYRLSRTRPAGCPNENTAHRTIHL